MLAALLREHGLRPWLDRSELSPGRPWMPLVVDGLRASGACAVMIGPHGLGDWAREELAIAQELAVKNVDFRLFMVLLPGSPEPLDPQLAFLNTRGWVDLRGGLDAPLGIELLLVAVRPEARPAGTSDTASQVCPYRGLEVFEEEHRDFFFGRDDDVARAVEKLRSSRFLGLIGPSGSGKSSLARAGVVPALRAGRVPGSEAWRVRVLTPGSRPLTALAAQVVHLSPSASMQLTIDGALADERTLDLAVELALADGAKDERVLLLIDQFEELFTLCRDDRERGAFLDNLLHAATIPGGRTVAIAAMRADFYHRYAESPRLRRLLAEQQLLVGPLDADGLRDAITLPAAKVGLRLERGLSARILADVRDQPGALPLVEHVMLELWRRRVDGTLTLAAYHESGGVNQALARRAESVYLALTEPEQRLARDALLRLVQPVDGASDVRRRASLDELVSEPRSAENVQVVLRAMTDSRLVSVGRDDVSGEPVVELAHEALIREWPRLSEWLVEQREFLRERRRLSDSAEEWQHAGRDPSILMRGSRLSAWRERGELGLNASERAFLEASSQFEDAERRRAKRRVRLVVASSLGATVIVTAIALFALGKSRQADTERASARDALSRQYALTAVNRLSRNPQEAVYLARESLSTKPSSLGESALRSALAGAHPMVVMTGHEGPVNTVAMSGDHRLVVSAGADGTVRVWDWRGKRSGRIVERSSAAMLDAGFALDGSVVYSRDADGVLRVTSMRAVAKAPGEPIVRDVARTTLAPDDRHLLTSRSSRGELELWDLANPSTPPVRLGKQISLSAPRFNRDGSAFLTGGFDGRVRRWTLSGQSSVIARSSGPVRSAAFSPDKRSVVAAWVRGGVRVVRLDDPGAPALTLALKRPGTALFMPDDNDRVIIGRPGAGMIVWDLRHPRRKPIELAAPDAGFYWIQKGGPLVAYAEKTGIIRVWNAREPALEPELLIGHEGPVSIAKAVADAAWIVSGGIDGTVRVWDPRPATPRSIVAGAGDELRFTPDGRRLENDGGRLQIVPAAGGPAIGLAQTGKLFGTTAIDPDTSALALADPDRRILVWDLHEPARLPRILGPDPDLIGLAFTDHGRAVVTASWDGSVRVWKLSGASKSPSIIRRGDDSVYLNAVAFSPGAAFIAGADDGGDVRIWERQRPAAAPVVLRVGASEVTALAFAHDGRHLAVATSGGEIDVWDRLAPSTPVNRLRGHTGDVWSVAFSPDGRWLVSTSEDKTVRVWDWRDADALPVTLALSVESDHAEFTPDGSRIAATDSDGTVHLWRCSFCASRAELLALAAKPGVASEPRAPGSIAVQPPSRSAGGDDSNP